MLRVRVPLNVDISAAYCQGIFQCLESGHPVVTVGLGMSNTLVDRWVKLLAVERPLANAYMKERQMWCICR